MQTTTPKPSPSQGRSDSLDRRGLPLSTSPEAAALYREAIDAVLAAEARAIGLLDQAIACDATFALAHAARWMEAHSASDGDTAAASRDATLASLHGVSEWERSHVECIAALIDGNENARTTCRQHLDAHPQDILIVSQLIGNLFFHGGPGKREAVMGVLRPLTAHNRDDWAFLARLGFHTSELGDPEGAIRILDRALTLRPQTPFAAHAMAHALLESGEREESHRFLLDWSSFYDSAGPIDGHIQWHLSLGELESGEPEAAVERYLQSSAPGASHCAAGLLLADAGGLFFRMVLDGTPLDGMPRAELHQLLVRLQRALKIPFVAVHAAALAVALGDDDAASYLEAMGPYTGASGSEAATLVVKAFRAYLGGDWQACADALERDRASAFEAIGGSNEERALLGSLYASARAQIAAA